MMINHFYWTFVYLSGKSNSLITNPDNGDFGNHRYTVIEKQRSPRRRTHLIVCCFLCCAYCVRSVKNTECWGQGTLIFEHAPDAAHRMNMFIIINLILKLTRISMKYNRIKHTAVQRVVYWLFSIYLFILGLGLVIGELLQLLGLESTLLNHAARYKL